MKLWLVVDDEYSHYGGFTIVGIYSKEEAASEKERENYIHREVSELILDEDFDDY